MMKNKRGQISLLLFAVIFLVSVFLILLINPFGVFNQVKNTVNFWLTLGIWLLLQGVFIYIYFLIGKYAYLGMNLYKNKYLKWAFNIKKYIMTLK